MDKISPIKQRILQFIVNQNITKVEFCDKTGISYANMKGKSLQSEIGGDKVAEILSIYNEISPDWLILGIGSMFRSDQIESNIPVIDIKSMSFILDRYEAMVAENALLRKENEDLKLSRGKSSNVVDYTSNSEKIGQSLAAEPCAQK